MKRIIILSIIVMFCCTLCSNNDSSNNYIYSADASLNLLAEIKAPATISAIPEPLLTSLIETETTAAVTADTTAKTTTSRIQTTTERITEPSTITEVPTTITITAEPPAVTSADVTAVKKVYKKKPFAVKPDELNPKNMPVLMYHTSSENNPGGLTELYVKPSEFEKQVKYLSENGYTFCTFDDYYCLNSIRKPVFITFDDGYRENYTEIFPILKKYNAKITLFLIINSITDSNLTIDMIKEMSDSGLVKFESHTNTHPSLSAISGNNARLTDEIQNSKLKIEEITGKKVVALSYPNGEFNQKVKDKVKEFYSFGLRKDLGMHNTEYDTYEVRRIRINRSTTLETFIKLVS